MFSICLLPTAGLPSRPKNDTASSPELFFHKHGSSSGDHGCHVCGSCFGEVAILEVKSGEATTGPRKKIGGQTIGVIDRGARGRAVPLAKQNVKIGTL